MNWAFGETCTAFTSELQSKWEKLKIIQTGYEIPQYSPWINFSHLTKEEFEKLSSIKGKIVDQEEELALIADILTHQGIGLKRVGIQNNNFDTLTNISKYQYNFRKEIIRSTTLLFSTIPWMKQLYDKLIYNVIPLKLNVKGDKAGLSSYKSRGLIFHSVPNITDESIRRLDLAIDIAHELGHHMLYTYQSTGPIVSNHEQIHDVYSPIKGSERKFILVFHALCAISYMKLASNALLRRASSKSESAFLKKKIEKLVQLHTGTIESLKRSNAKYTRIGKILFDEFCMM